MLLNPFPFTFKIYQSTVPDKIQVPVEIRFWLHNPCQTSREKGLSKKKWWWYSLPHLHKTQSSLTCSPQFSILKPLNKSPHGHIPTRPQCQGCTGFLCRITFQADFTEKLPLGWGSQVIESSELTLGKKFPGVWSISCLIHLFLIRGHFHSPFWILSYTRPYSV